MKATYEIIRTWSQWPSRHDPIYCGLSQHEAQARAERLTREAAERGVEGCQFVARKER